MWLKINDPWFANTEDFKNYFLTRDGYFELGDGYKYTTTDCKIKDNEYWVEFTRITE